MDQRTTLMRSWMFVPGDRQRMIDKSLGLPVDAILMDIEDGVAPAAKDTARRQIADSLDQITGRKKENPSLRTPARFVRINAVGHERMHADLEHVIRPALEGLAVPKTETVDDVKIVERILDEREPKMGIPSGSVRLLIALESPKGLFNAYAIAASSPRIIGLMFGAEDFSNSSRRCPCPVCGRSLAEFSGYRRPAEVCSPIPASGIFRNVSDPPCPGR